MKKNEIINREFETRMMHCGLMAEIIAYRSCNDMDVRFETGHIRHGVKILAWNLKTLPKEQEWLMIPLKKVP